MSVTLNQYTVGDQVRLEATFRDEDGDLADPTTVTGEIRTPDQVDAALSIVRESLGVYYALFTVAQNGLHEYRIEGAGAIIAAAESQFTGQGMFVEEAE
jgi:hypothetical protein